MVQPHPRVLEREPAALGELDGEALQAAARDAGEAADAVVGDREVRQAADGDEELGAVALPGGLQRADHAERREVDALSA